ncbi:MAG: ArnT family glycosyltransferase [Candidatus Hinthialibacter sp.]
MEKRNSETPSISPIDSAQETAIGFTPIIAMVLALWTLTLSLWLYIYSVRHGGTPCWDGFERCAWASHIWYDIRHFDLYHLWKHINAQMVWPPLHSLITGLAFVGLGPSLATARLLSLAAFGGSGALIVYGFARRRDWHSCLGAALAWSLFTTSPIVVQQAVGIMSEGIGFFITLLILVTLPSSSGANTKRWGWSGLGLALFFLYKYNYAFLTYGGLLIARYFQAGASIRNMANKNNALLFGIPILVLGLWFIPDFQNKWDNLIYFIVNNPSAHQPWNFSTLFYYPQVIPRAFFAAPWISVLCLALVFIASPFSKRLSLQNPLVACCIVHFVAVAIHPMKMERFQFITMGLFFIMTGEAARTLSSHFFTHWEKRKPRVGSFKFAILTILIGLILLSSIEFQCNLYRREQLPQQNVYRAPITAVLDRLYEKDRTALLITHDQANPPAVTFYFMTGLDVLQRNVRDNISHWNHIFLFQSKDDVLALSEEERLRKLEYELYINRSNKIVIIESTAPWTIGVFPAIFAGVQEYIQLVPKIPHYQMMFEREFSRSNIRVRIYQYNPT